MYEARIKALEDSVEALQNTVDEYRKKCGEPLISWKKTDTSEMDSDENKDKVSLVDP